MSFTREQLEGMPMKDIKKLDIYKQLKLRDQKKAEVIDAILASQVVENKEEKSETNLPIFKRIRKKISNITFR